MGVINGAIERTRRRAGEQTSMSRIYQFTSESVGEGHPDKVADQISDAILDACLSGDAESHVACETFITSGLVVVGGEITTETQVNVPEIVRGVVKDIGYDNPAFGLDYRSMGIINVINPQSADIDNSIRSAYDRSKSSIGAGDQGIMFGYACNESEELMPIAIIVAHKIMQRAAEIRKKERIAWLGPDCKCQVTVSYHDLTPQVINTVVLSHHHTEDVTLEELTQFLTERVIAPVLSESALDFSAKTEILINPSGRFVIGGPQADAGLTGRKIISDSYGGAARHGGGAFSGKDPSKVDRSAAYMARKVAKNIVAAELATHCEIQLSYAIGVPEPVSVTVFTFGTERIETAKIEAAVRASFRFSPTAIIDELSLKQPIYRQTAVYGHFGRSHFPWELCDKVDQLRAAL